MKAEWVVGKGNAQAVIKALVQAISRAIVQGPIVVDVRKLSKTRKQEQHYHALMEEIARSIFFDAVNDNGHKRRVFSMLGKNALSAEVWKALLVDLFEQELRAMGRCLEHPSRCIRSLDGTRLITIRSSSRQFSLAEANEFIEFLYAFGASYGMTWRGVREEQHNGT